MALPCLSRIVSPVRTAILEQCCSSGFLSAAVPLAPPAASRTPAGRNVSLRQSSGPPPRNLRLERWKTRFILYGVTVEIKQLSAWRRQTLFDTSRVATSFYNYRGVAVYRYWWFVTTSSRFKSCSSKTGVCWVQPITIFIKKHAVTLLCIRLVQTVNPFKDRKSVKGIKDKC